MTCSAIILFMDSNQTKIIELLRAVYLIAVKEIERLNLWIAELENRDCQREETPIVLRPTDNQPSDLRKVPENEIMNDKQVATCLNISVGTVRRWRLFRKGPKFAKIGAAVRYKRADVEIWLSSCPGLR